MADFYIDFVNGSDGNAGTTGATAWKTINKYTNNTRSTGDRCFVRGGMAHPTIVNNINFLTHKLVDTYLELRGDNGQVDWGGGANQDQVQIGTGSNTNVTFGSTIITVVGEDVTATIVALDGFRLAGDVRNYEVESVTFSTDTTITLYLPYREITQTGVTSFKIPSKPLIDFAGNFNLVSFDDGYWFVTDLDFKGSTDSLGMFNLHSPGLIFDGVVLRDITNTSTEAVNIDFGTALFYRTRFSGNLGSGAINQNGGNVKLDDVLFDNNTKALQRAKNLDMQNVTMKNSIVADIDGSGGLKVTGRNVDLQSTTQVNVYTRAFALLGELRIEDFGGVKGDNRTFSHLDETEGVPTLQTDTTTVRPDGGDTSIKCTGSDIMSTNNVNSRVLLNEWIIDANTISKTYTVYFNLPAVDFTAAPASNELYLEIEYLENSSLVERIVELSSGTVLADGNWNTISITAQPKATGVLYLRAYYAKTKESAKTNIFYTDTNIGIV